METSGGEFFRQLINKKGDKKMKTVMPKDRTPMEIGIWGTDKPIPVPETLDEWIEVAKRDVSGKKIPKESGWSNYLWLDPIVADRKTITRFAWTCGDDNPLYTDPDYAAKARYGCLIAPPGFPLSIVYTSGSVWGGVFTRPGTFPFRFANGGVEFNHFDVIRVNDGFRAEKTFKGLQEKSGRQWGRFVLAYSESRIINQHGEVPCVLTGWSGLAPVAGLPEGIQTDLVGREMYRYTEEERNRIRRAYESEVRRGSKPRLWEDVKVGDELPGVVKGPLSLADMIDSQANILGPMWRGFGLNYKDGIDPITGEWRGAEHPITGWKTNGPIDHEDWMLCKLRGLPLPFDEGVLRSSMSYYMFSNWMGDDGFLRRLKTTLRRWNFIGDTLWYSGKVVKKEKTEEGNAVEINWKAVNQLGEVSIEGDAAVLLPTRKEEVHLPIPGMPKVS